MILLDLSQIALDVVPDHVHQLSGEFLMLAKVLPKPAPAHGRPRCRYYRPADLRFARRPSMLALARCHQLSHDDVSTAACSKSRVVTACPHAGRDEPAARQTAAITARERKNHICVTCLLPGSCGEGYTGNSCRGQALTAQSTQARSSSTGWPVRLKDRRATRTDPAR